MFAIEMRMGNSGEMYYLRSTVYTRFIDRRSTYATEAEAQAAFDKSKKFHKAAVNKAARIAKVEG